MPTESGSNVELVRAALYVTLMLTNKWTKTTLLFRANMSTNHLWVKFPFAVMETAAAVTQKRRK